MAKPVALKLAKKHPNKKMRFGKHLVENIAYLFDLDKKEIALLETKGPAVWIKKVASKGVDYKQPEKKAMSPEERLIADLKEKGIKLSGKESSEDLEEMMKKIISK